METLDQIDIEAFDEQEDEPGLDLSPIDRALRETRARGPSPATSRHRGAVEARLESERYGLDDAASISPRGAVLGEVIEARSLDFPGRVLVRWLDGHDRPHERWLLCLRGLQLRSGDEVLLSKLDNVNSWVVTGAIQRGHPRREDVRELNVEEARESLDVMVDGRRVEVEGDDEVVLRCGLASITLRRNGRVVIRGTHVESRSAGTNRIKGGSVQIN